jgi:methionine biosynthesis protein MetW
LVYLFADFDYFQGIGPSLDYDAYWQARARLIEDASWKALETYKRKLYSCVVQPGSTVADLGCGDGSLLEFLRQTNSTTGYGLELSAISSAKARARGLNVIQGDIMNDSIDIPATDYIILSQVLEHLPNPESILHRVRDRFTKRLIVDIPNTGVVTDRLRLLFGRFPKQWVFHPAEHLRFWTVRDFLHCCKSLGLEVESYHGLFDPYFDFPMPLWKLLPGLFSRYVLYVIKKAGEE